MTANIARLYCDGDTVQYVPSYSLFKCIHTWLATIMNDFYDEFISFVFVFVEE